MIQPSWRHHCHDEVHQHNAPVDAPADAPVDVLVASHHTEHHDYILVRVATLVVPIAVHRIVVEQWLAHLASVEMFQHSMPLVLHY